MNKIKIAIVGTKLMQWTGGIDFLIDFIKILDLHPEKYEFEVFLPRENRIDSFVRKILRIPRNQSRIKNRLNNECPDVPIVYYWDRMSMDSFMKNINDNSYITVSYIYDFQHKYFPELFSKREIKIRDTYFKKMLLDSDFAITQSYDTKNDVKKYYGELSDKVYVMYAYPHYVPIDNISFDILCAKYGISKPYFIVCNQFWIHKNHRIVFDALEKLYNDGFHDVMVICTGDTSDYRNRNYFNELYDYISKLNCFDNIKILGYIKKNDQLTLLKNCISLIQPTLFEGNPGGGAVVDAMAYGVPCVVSGIPVNKEIPNCFGVNNVSFFDSDNSEMLSKIMEKQFNNYNVDIMYESKLNYENYFIEYDNVISELLKRKSI